MGNCTLVAVDADVVLYLHVKGSVSKNRAPLDALAAANAEIFVDRILIIRQLDEFPVNGGGRAELVFRAGVAALGIGPEVAAAEIAIAADRIGVEAFNRRWRKNAMRCATPALCAFFRIDLPDEPRRPASRGRHHRPADEHRCRPANEIAPVFVIFRFHLSPSPHFPSLNFTHCRHWSEHANLFSRETSPQAHRRVRSVLEIPVERLVSFFLLEHTDLVAARIKYVDASIFTEGHIQPRNPIVKLIRRGHHAAQ
jgi:hypothetical protein